MVLKDQWRSHSNWTKNQSTSNHLLYKPNTGTRRYVFYIANTGLLRPKNLRIANTGYLRPKISGDVKNVKLWPIEFILDLGTKIVLVISPSSFCQRLETSKSLFPLCKRQFICNTLTLSSTSIVLSCHIYPSVSSPYLVTKSTAQAYLNKDLSNWVRLFRRCVLQQKFSSSHKF